MKHDPVEALQRIILPSVLVSTRRPPGAVVAGCDAETREALSRLTSEQLASARVPNWVCRPGGRRGRASLPVSR